MRLLASSQIRGARAMLAWSLVDLAKAAHVSVLAITRAEKGVHLVPHDVGAAVRQALEAAGVFFLDDDGTGPGLRLSQADRRNH